MEKLILEEVKLQTTEMGTRVNYIYHAPKKLQKYIKGEPLFVEFPCDMREVSVGILTIPFVGIMLTATMLLDIEICVPALEASFLQSIKEMSLVYEEMYPKSGLSLKVHADRVELCEKCLSSKEKCGLFFTGGVDATSALIGLLDKKPILVNIWGGDLRLTDQNSHNELEKYLFTLTNYLGLEYCFIKTNAREMFYEDELGYLTSKHVGKFNEYGWWATIAHSLSMSVTAIPYMWKNDIKSIYIGSTHAKKENSYDANNEKLLAAIGSNNYAIKIADGEFVRNEKVTKIVVWKKKTNAPVQLKVCWKRVAGKNCSACEKCYRTILNILSNFGDPNDFGFCVDKNLLLNIKEYVETHHIGIAFWGPIQDAFIANQEFWNAIPEIAWILTIKFNSTKTLMPRLKRKLLRCIGRG